MNRNNNLNYILLGFALLCTGICNAQNFKYEAALEPVAEEQFYSIPLKPELLAKLKEDRSDIRVFDETHKEEIPYVLHQEQGGFNLSYFQEHPIVEKKSVPKRYTQLIIQNRSKTAIDNFCIISKNSDVYKTAKLSGSQDQQTWFVIKDDYFLGSLYSENSIQSERTINFPLSDYPYFKLEISDSLNEPLYIQKIGCYAMRKVESLYDALPKPLIVQSDSAHLKQSFIRIKFTEPYPIHKFSLAFSGPKFYNRSASFYQVTRMANGTESLENIQNFRVFSNAENTLHVNELRAKEYLLVIDNQDNKSLTLDAFLGYGLKTDLRASLKPQTQYNLKFGDLKTNAPVYDLEYFKDSIPVQPKEIAVLEIKSSPETTLKYAPPAQQWFKNKLWIWLSLGLVAILMAYISFKMIKDLDKRKDAEQL